MTNRMKDTAQTPRVSGRKGKSDGPAGSKEDRLADALRANLRRRKAPRKTDADDDNATEKPQDES